jgi:ABC-type uncharacterized transport system permease subunit
MNSPQTNNEPSTNERRVLALAIGVLGVLLAMLIWFRPGSLVIIASISFVAWCASMLLNKDEPPRRQWMGVLIPLIAGSLYGLTQLVARRPAIAIATLATLILLGVCVWLGEAFGRWFYNKWQRLFLPLAWSISTLLLVLVYYLVLTPIGLLMRVVGRDPLQQKFDRGAASYWVKRSKTANSERYFRQF